ncbi:thioredoxin family protein [uncultured Polaribacter sp.]|uniref:thioredoxin family protein n=1 Tax=uncultured Polaribacter sp. TaxID=174711 RepID=UPI00260B0ABB|nr:thioredoxin family protein [uncultured Polaribacter sp.]
MKKFGELISTQKPVLLDFYKEFDGKNDNLKILRNLAAIFGSRAKIIKIDISKNEFLADALDINTNPTFMIYKNGEMKWRETGVQDETALISLLNKYI